MKKKFLLITLIMCILGGINLKTLNAQITVEIGDKEGGTSTNVPVRTYGRYSLSQTIYDISSQISSGSEIESIAYYVTESGVDAGGGRQDLKRKITIYISEIQETTFNGTTTLKVSEDDLVYDDWCEFTENAWTTIELNTPRTYNGGKLMICVYDATNGYTWNDTKFKTTYNGNNVCLRTESNNNNPASGTYTGTKSPQIPNIQLTYTEATSTTPQAPDAPKIDYPKNETDIFNPALNFTLGNHTEDYQILMGEGTNEMTAVTAGWVEKTNNTVSYQTNNLKSNTAYSWKVVARCSDGGTGYLTTESEAASFTTRNITVAPGDIAISGNTPEDGAEVDYDPQLSWTFGENTESYKVLFAKEGDDLFVAKDWTNTKNAEGATFNTSEIKLDGEYGDPGLDANTTYKWQIVTKNSVGETPSDVFTFTKLGAPDDVTPINPVDGATDVTNTVLSWRFDGNATHYRVLMDLGYGLEYVVGNNNTWIDVPGETASFNAASKNLAPNKEYSWCVDVKNGAGVRAMHDEDEEDINPAIFSFTTSDVAPVTNTAPEDGAKLTEETTTLTWSYGSTNKVTQYQVLLGADSTNLDIVADWTDRGVEGTGMVASGSYTTDTLEPNTKYYWQVNVKKGEGGAVINGEIWSFVSMLSAPQYVTVNPENAYPTATELYKTATTTVTWEAVPNASGYNVYVDGIKKYELVTDEECEVSGLAYGSHAITVSAYYEGLGESEESEAASVKVAGYGNVNGRVIDSFDASYLANASVTFTGTDEFGTEQTYNFQTSDSYETQGYFSGSILAGTYTMTIENEGYNSVTRNNVIVEASKTQNLGNIPLTSDYKFRVSLRNPSWNAIDILLTNDEWLNAANPPYGNYIVYLKKDGSVIREVQRYFALNQQTVLLNEFGDIWKELNNGTYQIGVAVIGSEIINWSDEIKKDYNIFETAGDITEEANWREGLPESTDDIFIVAAATIPSGKEVTYNNVTITNNASLTINGKMTAGIVVNEGKPSNLCINDGGQLIQNNEELNGKFVMNIVNPNNNNWGDNKDGWQFISSPIKGVSIESFIPNNGDYDLFKYDGDEDLEWRNRKANVESFGSTFEQGVGYLASYQSAVTATFTGTFNSATSHTWDSLTYNAEKPLANFHLLGNPFTFNMDMTAATFNNLVNGVAIVNNEGGYTYDVTTIPVGDGFFVQAIEPANATDFISLSYGVRAAKSEKSNSLNITATGNAGKDNVVINFAGKSEGFNKLQNFNDAIATVYVAEDGKNYGIYNCDADVQEVELNFNANKMGNYTISIEPNGEFETLTLVDRFTGVETNMLLEDYTFTAMSSDNHNRFIVRMVYGQQSTDDSHFVYQSGEELILNIQGEVQIVDVLGRVVYNGKAMNDINHINVSSFNSGAYMVRVMNGNDVKVEKVVIY